MANVSETKMEMLAVELKREDVRDAVVEAARKQVQGHHTRATIDDSFDPQVVVGEYGGFQVFFRRKPEPRGTAVA